MSAQHFWLFAGGAAQALMSVEGVRVAEVHPANGSVLVAFVPASRDVVLLAVRSLDVLALPTAEPGLGEASGAASLPSRFSASTAHNLSTFAIAVANARPLLSARTSRDACAPGTQGTRR